MAKSEKLQRGFNKNLTSTKDSPNETDFLWDRILNKLIQNVEFLEYNMKVTNLNNSRELLKLIIAGLAPTELSFSAGGPWLNGKFKSPCTS